jgi:protein TonB
MMELMEIRNGLGKALPASILLHVLAAAFVVSATMPGPAATPPVIDLTLLAPPGVEGGTVPARAQTRRPASTAQATAPLPTPLPERNRTVGAPEPDPAPKAPVAGIPILPEAGTTSSRNNYVSPEFEGSRSSVGRPFSIAMLPPESAPAAVGTSTGPGRAIDREPGYASLRDAIQRGIAYPPVARKMGWEGDVVVAFRIHPDGSADDIRVVRGSGFAVLDRNAVEAVRGAAPFRNPPGEAEILTPVVYRLTRGASPGR